MQGADYYEQTNLSLAGRKLINSKQRRLRKLEADLLEAVHWSIDLIPTMMDTYHIWEVGSQFEKVQKKNLKRKKGLKKVSKLEADLLETVHWWGLISYSDGQLPHLM